jgi:hypothetical protein
MAAAPSVTVQGLVNMTTNDTVHILFGFATWPPPNADGGDFT